jgi:cytochrome c
MRIAVLLAALGCTVAVAAADDARERAFRGKRLAEANCATCHAIAQFDASSLRTAPPLRTLGRTIAFERLRAMLGGQVFLRHAVMPDFQPDTGRRPGDLHAKYRLRSLTPLEGMQFLA